MNVPTLDHAGVGSEESEAQMVDEISRSFCGGRDPNKVLYRSSQSSLGDFDDNAYSWVMYNVQTVGHYTELSCILYDKLLTKRVGRFGNRGCLSSHIMCGTQQNAYRTRAWCVGNPCKVSPKGNP